MENKLRVIAGRRNGKTNRVFYLQQVDLMRSKEFYGLTHRQFYEMKSPDLEKHIYEYLKKRYKGPNKILVTDRHFVYPEEAMAAEAFNAVFNRDFDLKMWGGQV